MEEDPIESVPDTPLTGPPQNQLVEDTQVIRDIVDKAVDEAMETAYYALQKYINQTINALVPVLVHKLVNRYTLINIQAEVAKQVKAAERGYAMFGYQPPISTQKGPSQVGTGPHTGASPTLPTSARGMPQSDEQSWLSFPSVAPPPRVFGPGGVVQHPIPMMSPHRLLTPAVRQECRVGRMDARFHPY